MLPRLPRYFSLVLIAAASMVAVRSPLASQGASQERKLLAQPGLYKALKEPPCSYCIQQQRKGIIRDNDRVVAWLRGVHNGGAIPIRLFLSAPRVINDTYGLFFYDPDGAYVSAFPKDYGFEFHGWRGGVMVVKGPDGSLWSALTGKAFEGPLKGKQLQRMPSLVTDWSYWLLLHPESTVYDVFDGKRYPAADLPSELSAGARETMGQVDSRLKPMAPVLGVQVATETRAYSLDGLPDRAVFNDTIGGRKISVFWYGPTRTASAWRARLNDQDLTFYADEISPDTAPIKDRETGTRWSLAGRGIDGPLRGQDLNWINSVQCRWYAWSNENPGTTLFGAQK